MNPEATIEGIAISPTSPNLHSNANAIMSPPTIEEKFMRTVDTMEVTRLLTCLESMPNLLAAKPPLFYLDSNHFTGNLNILW